MSTQPIQPYAGDIPTGYARVTLRVSEAVTADADTIERGTLRLKLRPGFVGAVTHAGSVVPSRVVEAPPAVDGVFDFLALVPAATSVPDWSWSAELLVASSSAARFVFTPTEGADTDLSEHLSTEPASPGSRPDLATLLAGITARLAALEAGGGTGGGIDPAELAAIKEQLVGTVNVNRLPSRVLTADNKRVGSVEVMAVRAVDHVAIGSANMSDDFQAMVNDAASRGMRLALQDGVYKMTNISLPKYAHISTTSTIGVVFPSGEGRGRVRIQQIDGATTPVFKLASGQGRGIVLRDMTIMGQPMSAAFPTQTETMQPALLSADEMFECRLDRVQFTQNWGPAMVLNSCSNTQFDDVQVKMCGHPSTAAVVLSGAAVCNVVDFNRLRVEFQPNVAIQVGNLADATGWPAEFIRFVGLHAESPDPASVTGMPTSYYNADGLVRLGNVRSVDFDHPFIYGSVGGLITHEQASGLGFTNGHLGGITITGGTLLGRGQAGNNRSGQNQLNPFLIRLVSGDNFVTRGTRFVRYATAGSAVRIESGYGARVDIDTHAFHGTDDTTLTAIKDMRSVNIPTVTVESPAGTGATASLSAGSTSRSGTITLTSGTASTTTGPQFKVLFPKPFGSACRVTLTPVGTNAAGRQAYLSNQWNTGFQVGFGVAPNTSQGYVFNYTVVEP